MRTASMSVAHRFICSTSHLSNICLTIDLSDKKKCSHVRYLICPTRNMCDIISTQWAFKHFSIFYSDCLPVYKNGKLKKNC